MFQFINYNQLIISYFCNFTIIIVRVKDLESPNKFLSKVSPTVLDYGAVPTGVGIAASKAGMKLGIPQADNDWGKKAILEFHTDTPNETIGLGKGKKFKWVKKLPKIGFKKGPLATLLYLLGGATAGTIVDKGIEEVFNVENK